MARSISVDHHIKLTNGKYLVIQENNDETISIASGYLVDESDEDGESYYIENDYYIVNLTKDGVLVYTSSGQACHDLVEGIMND